MINVMISMEIIELVWIQYKYIYY